MGLLRTMRGMFDQLRKPPSGEMINWSPTLDGSRPYLTQDVTFDQLRNLLLAGDSGDAATALRVFDELETKDPRLASVAKTRRLALTGLEWDIVSAADQLPDESARGRADEAAAYCREVLSDAVGLDETLNHLARAIGSNLAVAEIVWESNRPVRLAPVPSWRIASDYRTPGVRIAMPGQPSGVELPPAKFIVHIPDARCGFPFDASIYRAIAHLIVLKQLALADWGTFCQLFGMPVRVGTYKRSASADEKQALREMLEGMGSAGWAMASDAVNLTFAESSARGTSPFKELVEYCDRTITIAFLGGHLTVDTAQATGTLAAGAVQNEVRLDLRDDDIRSEGRTIREQLLEPMVRYQWPKGRYAVPYFTRIVPETRDRAAEAELLRKATQELGLPVERDYVYGTLGIPAPELDGDGTPVNPVIERFAAVSPFAEEGPL